MEPTEKPMPAAEPSDVTPIPGEPERLLTVLTSLEDLITKQTSLKFAFLRGMVYGLGTVIGATLLIALLGGILVTAIDSISDWPLIGDYIENNAAEYFDGITQ